MLLRIPSVLTRDQIEIVQTMLADAMFVDGKLSAGKLASRVKHNQELDRSAPQIEHLNKLVMGHLVAHPLYRSGALPYRVATPFYARYTQGMSYGDHVDDPIMGPPTGAKYRADVAITLFLNSPDAYEGGELVVGTSFGEQDIKLPPGDAVMYPASSLHHVEEVTSGERLVAVTWVQSIVRDTAQRELLFELDQAREALLSERPDSPQVIRINKVYNNLVRMWGDV